MSKLSITERYRRVLPVLWIAVATCVVLGLSAGMASAAQQLVEICHKGQTISVDVHAVPAHLEHGDTVVPCDQAPPCACSLEFNPVTCADGRTYVNQCIADCAGAPGPCTRLGVCSNIWNPVTCNGVVYANLCQALNAGAGPCDVLCPCPLIYAPVRCSDGRTFINACVAACQQASGCAPIP